MFPKKIKPFDYFLSKGLKTFFCKVRIVGQQAAAAVLGAPGETGELPAAVRHQVQGTEAEQAVEPFRIRSLVAGKEFALPVGKELVPAAHGSAWFR